MLDIILALLLGYLIGSLPSAYLVARLRGKNVFEVGSGNMGAMNTARNLGWGLGVLVLLLDLAKGALASYLGLTLFGELAPALAAGIGAVLGHAFSVYVGFRGGKALATTLGAALPLYPVPALFSLLVLVVLTLALKKRSNLAACLTVCFYPFVTFGYYRWQGADAALSVALTTAIIAAVVLYKHIPSLKQEVNY